MFFWVNTYISENDAISENAVILFANIPGPMIAETTDVKSVAASSWDRRVLGQNAKK